VPGISPRRLADWITEELKKTGVKIQREALAVLVKSGRDMNYLARELERLALCHRGQTVTTGDLTGIESDPASFNVFQLTDALLKKNTREALQALASLLHKGEPVTLIVHMITRNWCCWKGAGSGSPGRTFFHHSTYTRKQRFRVDKMLRSSMSTEDLRYALKRMAEIDYAVKNTSQDHRLLLETMIVEICETGTVCRIDYRQQRWK
jgi:DNA polymerase III delta subunit